MIPVRVVPPATPVVELAALKAHLRVDGNDDDELITAYEQAAVAHLDGYRGALGRCIISQGWAVTYGQAGTYRLPMQDVVSAKFGADVDLDIARDHLGAVVTIPAAGTVTMTCALPPDALAVARMAVRLLVGHWYEHRAGVVTGTIATSLPLSVGALVDQLRQVRA